MSTRLRRLAGTVLVIALPACGGGSAASGNTTTTTPTTGTSGSPGPAADEPSGHHHGLTIHVENIHAGGALPAEPSPTRDALEVSFDVLLAYDGDRPLTDLHFTRARLIADDGRSITFGVLSDAFDGTLPPHGTRTLTFHKNPDSATPRPTSGFCNARVRVEVSFELAGRSATATSRHAVVQCPASQ